MLNQNLSQRLLQKLSPQQIQLMKLLQIPTASLEERIQEELEINPALEESNEYDDDDDPYQNLDDGNNADGEGEDKYEDEEAAYDADLDLSNYLDSDDEVADYKLRGDSYDQDEEQRTVPISVASSFHEYLMSQLGMLNLPPQREKIARQVIGSIDDDGYLRRDLDALVDDLAFGQHLLTTEAEVEEVLKLIQHFDPDGVGARDLQECLLIQLSKRKTPENRYIQIAERLLRDYFEEFAKKHYERLLRSMGITDRDLKLAVDEILKLNPKPGSSYVSSTKADSYIIPDFILTNSGGELILSLNARNAPDLRISDSYRDMLREYARIKNKNRAQKEALLFIKQKIDLPSGSLMPSANAS